LMFHGVIKKWKRGPFCETWSRCWDRLYRRKY